MFRNYVPVKYIEGYYQLQEGQAVDILSIQWMHLDPIKSDDA